MGGLDVDLWAGVDLVLVPVLVVDWFSFLSRFTSGTSSSELPSEDSVSGERPTRGSADTL